MVKSRQKKLFLFEKIKNNRSNRINIFFLFFTYIVFITQNSCLATRLNAEDFPAEQRQTRVISRLSDISDQYKGFIIDLYGVIHDGKILYPEALSCLGSLHQQGKRVVFLSNAPRLSYITKERLTSMGIPPGFYVGIITSGDEGLEALKDQTLPVYRELGRSCFYLGRKEDFPLVEQHGLISTNIEGAAFILCTNPQDGEQELSVSVPVLQRGLERNIPLVCLNPDLYVFADGIRQVCAGTFAQWYTERGGTVFYHGKPFPSIYERALPYLQISDPSQILAIGDSLRTDITGAQAMSYKSIFIASGIHKDDLTWEEGKPTVESLEELFQREGTRPDFVLPFFR